MKFSCILSEVGAAGMRAWVQRYQLTSWCRGVKLQRRPERSGEPGGRGQAEEAGMKSRIAKLIYQSWSSQMEPVRPLCVVLVVTHSRRVCLSPTLFPSLSLTLISPWGRTNPISLLFSSSNPLVINVILDVALMPARGFFASLGPNLWSTRAQR